MPPGLGGKEGSQRKGEGSACFAWGLLDLGSGPASGWVAWDSPSLRDLCLWGAWYGQLEGLSPPGMGTLERIEGLPWVGVSRGV